jgi:hypothetical protein
MTISSIGAGFSRRVLLERWFGVGDQPNRRNLTWQRDEITPLQAKAFDRRPGLSLATACPSRSSLASFAPTAIVAATLKEARDG